MVENSAAEKRQSEKRLRGRPQVRPDDETRHLIIEAAALEFQAKGYAGSGMNAVAQGSGVSTKTLYRLFPTKADLFTSVIADRIGLFMLEIEDDVVGPLDLEPALRRILVAFGNLTLSAEVIAINRLVIGECGRFPEIATAFYKTAILQTQGALEAWIGKQCQRGLIKLENPAIAVGMLRGMMAMEPQRSAMMGQRGPADAAEIAERARLCARLFLNGCRVVPEPAAHS